MRNKWEIDDVIFLVLCFDKIANETHIIGALQNEKDAKKEAKKYNRRAKFDAPHLNYYVQETILYGGNSIWE